LKIKGTHIMSIAVTISATVGAFAGAAVGLVSAYSDSEERSIFFRTSAGALLGASLFGGFVTVLENDKVTGGLKEIFSSEAPPAPSMARTDIDECVIHAPNGSKVIFTRNPDGTSSCTYEMK
jgi:hypothetical protein